MARHGQLRILSLPITTKKSYIYCQNHFPKAEANNLPAILRWESKATEFAIKGWKKMSNSEMAINKKITQWIHQLLDTVPYDEGCLRSFPSRMAMMREIKDNVQINQTTDKRQLNYESDKTGKVEDTSNSEFNDVAKETSNDPQRFLLPSQLEEHSIQDTQLSPIPIIHPTSQSPSTILKQLHSFRNDSRSYHYKRAMYCALGLPLTLPFAALPILPNVPGFYLAYRLYCHIKSLAGIKHLDYLLGIEKSNAKHSKPVEDPNNFHHIVFRSDPHLERVYNLAETSKHALENNPESKESLVLTEDIINRLCEELDIKHLNHELKRALKQETARLNQKRD